MGHLQGETPQLVERRRTAKSGKEKLGKTKRGVIETATEIEIATTMIVGEKTARAADDVSRRMVDVNVTETETAKVNPLAGNVGGNMMTQTTPEAPRNAVFLARKAKSQKETEKIHQDGTGPLETVDHHVIAMTGTEIGTGSIDEDLRAAENRTKEVVIAIERGIKSVIRRGVEVIGSGKEIELRLMKGVAKIAKRRNMAKRRSRQRREKPRTNQKPTPRLVTKIKGRSKMTIRNVVAMASEARRIEMAVNENAVARETETGKDETVERGNENDTEVASAKDMEVENVAATEKGKEKETEIGMVATEEIETGILRSGVTVIGTETAMANAIGAIEKEMTEDATTEAE